MGTRRASRLATAESSDTTHCPLPTADYPLSTTHSPLSPAHWFLLLNALALVLTAVWLRGHSLGNIPGLNGDEAWYGVEAWRMLHGGAADWHTPTGNPLNPLFIGPLALVHLWLPPSIVLLRSVALAGGLAALSVNWLCCRRVFDRRTAAVSTVALAVLPINIAYSRLAWDASQSLAVNLPVLYFALAAVRFPHRFGRWIAASVLALAVAFWVHPTNIFLGAAILVAAVAHWRSARRYNVENRMTNDEMRMTKEAAVSRPPFVIRHSCFVLLSLAIVLLATWACTAHWTRGPLPGRIAERMGSLGRDFPLVSTLYPRLLTGGTIYRYVAGSRSWFEWPLPANFDGWGIDVSLFWIGIFGSAWLLWRNHRLRFRTTDGALLAAWALAIVAFLLIAGPRAMAPGQERFAIGLIGLTVLLLARGAALAWEAAPARWRVVLAAATLAGWPLLADFHAHYFKFIEQTGGQSHFTFRTGPMEPKQAALLYILQEAASESPLGAAENDSARIWIVCSEWWNLWPIRYLAIPHRDVCVAEPSAVESSDDYRRAMAEGRVWFVEFCNTDAQRRVELQLADQKTTRRQLLDFGGRPILCVLHPLGE